MLKRPFHFQFSLRTLLFFTFLCGCVMAWWFGRYARWTADLADPAKRNEALVFLLNEQRYHDSPRYKEKNLKDVSECDINSVVVSRQPSGLPYYAVFRKSFYKGDDNHGKPKGHILVFDGNGYILSWYQGANVIDSGDVFSVAPSEPMHCADSIWYGGCNEFYVVPIAGDLAPVLLITFRNKWRWHWVVKKENGETKIQLGPRPAKKEAGKIELEPDPKRDEEDKYWIEHPVEFVWSQKQHRYIGPDGAPELPFMRLDPSKEREQLQAYDQWTPPAK